MFICLVFVYVILFRTRVFLYIEYRITLVELTVVYPFFPFIGVFNVFISSIGPSLAFINIFMSYAHIRAKGAELAYS